ncbi:hypothetical protein J8273_0207 [Carpediemonas membranifera]|uniref:Uncharacterized protein n=1 Tax=Carpediemonas membranifera TaxID=201153 RepID=A0A8J6B605_9EUKA|nr:hypothetical protein J8273_0207 [Carpediemonas membranifera]|eukprot:KAG9394999.1 hypothetical protein J8273_0207 [Carpediemonas membranifera]
MHERGVEGVAEVGSITTGDQLVTIRGRDPSEKSTTSTKATADSRPIHCPADSFLDRDRRHRASESLFPATHRLAVYCAEGRVEEDHSQPHDTERLLGRALILPALRSAQSSLPSPEGRLDGQVRPQVRVPSSTSTEGGPQAARSLSSRRTSVSVQSARLRLARIAVRVSDDHQPTRQDTSPSDGSYHRCLPRRLPLISPRPRNPEEGGAAHQADSSRPLCPHLRGEVRMGTDSVIGLSGARDRLREFYNTPPGGQGQTLLLSHSSGSGRQDHRSGDLGQDPRETDLLRYNRPRGFPPAETPSTGPTLQGATARVAATAKRAPSPRHQRTSVALGHSPLLRPRRIDRRIWSQVGSSRARRVWDLSLGHVHSRTKSRIYQREGARGNPTGHPSDRQTEFPTRAIDLLRQHISSGLAQQGGVYEGSTSGPAHSSPDPEGGGGPEPDTPWTTHSGHHQPGSRSAVQRLLTTPFLSGVQHGICPRGVGSSPDSLSGRRRKAWMSRPLGPQFVYGSHSPEDSDSESSDSDWTPEVLDLSSLSPLPRGSSAGDETPQELDVLETPSLRPGFELRSGPPTSPTGQRTPTVQCDGVQDVFHRVLRSDRVIHLNHASARTVAGWVARFEGSRDRSLSDRDQLVAFLKDEGSFCGPSNVARKGYWIVQLQEFLKDWHPPANSKYIVKQAAKGASTAGTTGGSRAITKAEMIEALGRRSDDFESYQACLFGAVAYLTVSRGIEILSLCPADLELLKNGDILLHIQRTKTILTGVKKRVPYVWLSAAFNPALALRRWVEGTHYLADDTPIWRVIVNGRLSRDKPLTAAHLRRVVKALFGPRTGLHSFRKGAASEMALSGVPLEVILSMGTWKDVTSLRSYVADAIRTNEDLTRRMNLSLLGPHF